MLLFSRVRLNGRELRFLYSFVHLLGFIMFLVWFFAFFYFNVGGYCFHQPLPIVAVRIYLIQRILMNFT